MIKIYQEDSFKLDADRITTDTDEVFGDVTTFHDVVIASEIVQQYNDGLALKTRDELEAYAWTADGRWIIAGAHPQDGIISERDQVAGRTVNVTFVKDLKDPKTKRKNRAGVRADVQVFNNKIAPELLADMKNGVKPDVSIGFFFNKDDTSGTVEDGTLKGLDFDYVQRNMFHDHLAVGIDSGRCPSPLCGLGADEIKKQLTGDPFAGFANFKACQKAIKKKNPDLTDEAVDKICGSLKAKEEDNKTEDNLMVTAAQILRTLLEGEYQELLGERDALKEKNEWWMILDWQEDEKLAGIFPHLDEDIRNQIIDAGKCPDCNKKAVGSDLSLEEINAKLDDLKEDRDKVREEMRVLEEELFSKTPEEKKRDDELRNQINQLWDEISDINDEIFAFGQAKTIKITESALNDAGECPEGQEWSEEHDKCVPINDGDVKETNPGFAPGKAEEECGEGMEWNAKQKKCVAIEDFSSKGKNLTPDEVFERYKKLSTSV